MILSFADSQTFGLSQSFSTTGMLISSLFISLFSKSAKQLTILSISLFFTGIFFSLWGISTNIFIITVMGFLFFVTLPFVNTSLDVLIRSNVSNAMQGRIWSIVSFISQLGMIIAFAIAGFLADKIFNPLLEPNGTLAASIGRLLGTGPGRGIGLIFFITGIFVAIIAVIIGNFKSLRVLNVYDKS